MKLNETMNGKTMDGDDLDFLTEMSKYLDVLGSDTRLKILKLIEKNPKDIRTISNEIKTTYENTNRHMDKLLDIGIVKREMGTGKQTSRGVRLVWKYSLDRGVLEAIMRSWAVFTNFKFELSGMEDVKKKISDEFNDNVPSLRILGGVNDGKILALNKDSINLGRVDQKNLDKFDSESNIVLSSEYKAVTRVSKPHARLTFEDNDWYIEDCDSKGGTYLNEKRLDKNKRIKLNKGDLIGLAKGSLGAHLLFNLPSE